MARKITKVIKKAIKKAVEEVPKSIVSKPSIVSTDNKKRVSAPIGV